LSRQFKPSSTFIDLDNSEEKDKDETRLFELSEFLGTDQTETGAFPSTQKMQEILMQTTLIRPSKESRN